MKTIDYGAVARELCERHQLRVDLHAHELERMLKLPERCWAICCGSGCRPCVDDLARIVRPVVERLEAEASAADDLAASSADDSETERDATMRTEPGPGASSSGDAPR